MTKQQIKDLVAAKIAGQGSMVDVGGALPAILDAIVDAIPEPEEGVKARVFEIPDNNYADGAEIRLDTDTGLFEVTSLPSDIIVSEDMFDAIVEAGAAGLPCFMKISHEPDYGPCLYPIVFDADAGDITPRMLFPAYFETTGGNLQGYFGVMIST